MGEFNFENEVSKVASFNKDQEINEKKINIESLDTSNFDKWIRNVKRVASSEGIPPDYRKKIWLMLSDKYLQERKIDWPKEEENCFNEQWRQENEELGIQIIKDLHRTGSSICTGPTGFINQAKLKKILLGYVRWNPEVGYCQGFNMLGALILKTMDKNESDSLKVMIYLIEGVLPSGYFNESLSGLQIDMAVFRDLMVLKLPRLAKHLQKLKGAGEERFCTPPLTNVFNMQWFLTMFCTCLATDCVLRVWDLVLLEGSDMLLRTALAVWNLLEDKILKTQTADDFYCKMGALSAELLNGHLTTTNGLIDRIMKFGSMPDIQKLRDKYRSKRLAEIYYSDEESDDESKIPQGRRGSTGNILSNNKERLALDVAILKRQYDRLRDRQRKAHVILSAAVSRQTQNSSAPQISVNHLLVGKNAILPKKGRVGPLKGAIPPARKNENINRTINLETRAAKDSLKKRHVILKQDNQNAYRDDSDATFRKRSDSSSYSEESDGGNSSTSTSLCDEDDNEDASLLYKTNYLNRNSSKSLQKVQNLTTDSQYKFLDNTNNELNEKKLENDLTNQRENVPVNGENLNTSITSTSQLSPIADINKYLCNSNISPIKTPISNFDYKYDAKSKDSSDSDYEQFEGVTNKYFERLNIDRPKYLDLNPTQIINKPTLENDLLKKYKTKTDEKSYEDCSINNELDDEKSNENDLPKCVHSNQNLTDKSKKYSSISCPEAGKLNFQFTVQSDSVLQIIEENSKILHRILNKSKENSQSLKSIEDSVDNFNLANKFKSDESLKSTTEINIEDVVKIIDSTNISDKDTSQCKRKCNDSEKLKRFSLDLNFHENKSKKYDELINLPPSPVQTAKYESIKSTEDLKINEINDNLEINPISSSENNKNDDKMKVVILLNSEKMEQKEIPELVDIQVEIKNVNFEEDDDYDRKLEALKLYNDKIIDKLIVSTNEDLKDPIKEDIKHYSMSVEGICRKVETEKHNNLPTQKANLDPCSEKSINILENFSTDTIIEPDTCNNTSTKYYMKDRNLEATLAVDLKNKSTESSFELKNDYTRNYAGLETSYDLEKKKITIDHVFDISLSSGETKLSTDSLYDTNSNKAENFESNSLTDLKQKNIINNFPEIKHIPKDIIKNYLPSDSYEKNINTTTSDDNITNRLESIKNTIKSIDNLCQDKRHINEKSKNFNNYFDAYNPIRKTNLLKKDTFEGGGTRSFVRSSSIRRPKIEEKEEQDNRIKRDNLLFDNNKSTEYLLNNSTVRDNQFDKDKFEIRHTTVTSTFYDRFLSQKSEKYLKIDKLDKTFSNEISLILNETGRRGSKSASNSPTRANANENNKYNVTTDCYLNAPDNLDVHIKSCDNILLRLNSINTNKKDY